MRNFVGILAAAGLLLSMATNGLADPPPKSDKKDDDAKGRASQLAGDIFAKVDKHKHGYINKYEFKHVDGELNSAIKQMAIDGLIGKGKPAEDAQSIVSAFNSGFADADSDHDKKVTLLELTDYVGRAIAAADQDLRLRAAAPHGKRH